MRGFHPFEAALLVGKALAGMERNIPLNQVWYEPAFDRISVLRNGDAPLEVGTFHRMYVAQQGTGFFGELIDLTGARHPADQAWPRGDALPNIRCIQSKPAFHEWCLAGGIDGDQFEITICSQRQKPVMGSHAHVLARR